MTTGDTSVFFAASVQTVSSGATSITLVNPSDTSKYSVGDWLLMAGLETMGTGYPANYAFFEYLQIASVDPTTGIIGFTSPLKNSYESTWPDLNVGATAQDQNPPYLYPGRASIFRMDPTWDVEVEVHGGTFKSPVQTYVGVRSAKFVDTTWDCVDTSQTNGIAPTQEGTLTLINVNMNCVMEVDKLNDQVIIQGGRFAGLAFQSSGGGKSIYH